MDFLYGAKNKGDASYNNHARNKDVTNKELLFIFRYVYSYKQTINSNDFF